MGQKKVSAEDKMFMDEVAILECVKTIPLKNTEGFDRIPQRILVDGIGVLIKPLGILFSKVYSEKLVPSQWLVSKTIPIYKNKGDKNEMSNYRPIANLCYVSKFFEKLILRIESSKLRRLKYTEKFN